MKRVLALRTRPARRVATLAAVVVVALVASTSAAALGAPFTVGTEVYGGGFGIGEAAPSLAVDAAGTAYIAWAAPNVGGNTVQYCVLPAGATACAPSGSLTPASAGVGENVIQPEVLIDDGIVSIIADTGDPGGPATSASADEPLEEWQAPDGGAAFAPVNGGQSPADTDADGQGGLLDGAVDVPGTNELGVLWIGGEAPSFSAFPLLDPPQCSVETSPPCATATLEPASDPDPIGPFSGEALAAGAGSNPGILALFPTDFSSGPLGCPPELTGDHDGTAFAYGSGDQSATDDYNVSPGSPDSAWQVPVTQLNCQHFIGAATGGPGGFGALANILSGSSSSSTSSIDYLPFDQSTLSFDKPQVTVVPEPAYFQEPSLSQDGGGGLYAVYELLGTSAGAGPLALSYSNDGGATWQGPAPLDPTLQNYVQNMTSSVGVNGDGWAAFVVGDTIEAVAFDAADAATSLSAAIAAPSTTSAGVTLPVRCAVVPCTVSAVLTSSAVGTAAAVTDARRGARRAPPIRLGTGTVTITRSRTRTLVVHLTAAGRRRLRTAGRHLRVRLLEGTRLASYTVHHTANLTLTVRTRRG